MATTKEWHTSMKDFPVAEMSIIMEIDKLPQRKESVLPIGIDIVTAYVAGHRESRELVNIVQAAP
jgi:hypothetical protein